MSLHKLFSAWTAFLGRQSTASVANQREHMPRRLNCDTSALGSMNESAQHEFDQFTPSCWLSCRLEPLQFALGHLNADPAGLNSWLSGHAFGNPFRPPITTCWFPQPFIKHCIYLLFFLLIWQWSHHAKSSTDFEFSELPAVTCLAV